MPPAPRPPRPPRKTASGASSEGPAATAATGTPGGATSSASEPDPPRVSPRAATGRTPALQKKLEEFFSAPALIYSFGGDEYGAHIIATRTPAMAKAWYDLAQENAAIKRMLTRLAEGSAWGGVVLSTSAVLIPLAVHHGMLPPVPDPFATIYPPPPEGSRGPIVPPPPPATPDPSTGAAAGGTPNRYTPPVAPGEPPGIVTVAGTNAVT